MEHIDINLVNWSRAQFALTALYHYLFVPITLGLSYILAIMETLYVTTGDEKWKDITKFWLKLFGINFAIGVATGLILEFEFGTNWANYSWIVGDIFGAPLAIEGLMAFFLETTFFAVMFFGWDKVSKRFHLLSTWLVAIGTTLSALWILVANGWMQHPVGMLFNPDTARHEMVDFWAVLFNENAVSKFLHTMSAGYVSGALFVLGISSWFLLKNKQVILAKRSIVIASTFGLISSIYVAISGDTSAFAVAQNQPVKLAAMEAIYKGESRAGIVAVGVLDPKKKIGDDLDPFLFKIEAPYALSILGHHSVDAFVPGIDDLVYGNTSRNIEGAASKIQKGKIAINALRNYKNGNTDKKVHLKEFRKYEKYLGYGYLEKPEDIVPNVPIVFYSFHIMVALGSWFILLFFMILYFVMTDSLVRRKFWLRAAVGSTLLGIVASEIGWIVAEVGRQPWVIQNLLPTAMGISNIRVGNVQVTFWLFCILFSVLLVAEVRIMLRQIVKKANEVQ